MRLRMAIAVCIWACAWCALTARGDGYLAAAGDDEPALCGSCGDCGCGCDDECCDNGLCGKRLFGLLLPSDHCFDRFISPVSNPFFFEDPRSLTEARGIFIDNKLPNAIGGPEAQIWAAQFRGRITENVSVIAPRLAYWSFPNGGTDTPIGFMSAPVGVKYNFVRDVERQLLVSGGITYFIPGSSRSYSNFGDGDLHFFLTGGKQLYDHAHWLSGTGFRIPLDNSWGTQMWYWSNQWDYELPRHIYPLVGLNWYHFMRSSNLGLTGPITGLDLVNLPAGAVAGRNVVTSVVGLRWKPTGNFEMGGGYEFALTQNEDILSRRAYADVIFRY